jgi:hypothetical protein
MTFDQEINIAVAIGPMLAVVVAMITVYYTNRNNRQQILVGKLEELFEIIQTISRFYPIFKMLFPLVKQLLNPDNEDMRTFDDYKTSLDEEISESERSQIFSSLSRIEVLARCYTKGELQEKILKFRDLIYSFADFVFNAGGLQEAHLETGFPSFSEFQGQLDSLKKDIIAQLKI